MTHSQRVTHLGERVREAEMTMDYDLADMRTAHGPTRQRARQIISRDIARLRALRTEYTAAWDAYAMAVAVRDSRYILTAQAA